MSLIEQRWKEERNNTQSKFIELQKISRASRDILKSKPPKSSKNEKIDNQKHKTKEQLVEMILMNHRRIKKLEAMAKKQTKQTKSKKEILRQLDDIDANNSLKNMISNVEESITEEKKEEKAFTEKLTAEIAELKERYNESNAATILFRTSFSSSKSGEKSFTRKQTASLVPSDRPKLPLPGRMVKGRTKRKKESKRSSLIADQNGEDKVKYAPLFMSTRVRKKSKGERKGSGDRYDGDGGDDSLGEEEDAGGRSSRKKKKKKEFRLK